MAPRGGDLDGDTVTAVLVVTVLALALGPTAVAAFGVDAGSWLLQHDVLVAPAHSVVTVPLVDAGLDWRRLVVAGFVGGSLLLIAAASRYRPHL